MRVDWKKRLGVAGLSLLLLAPGYAMAQDMVGDPASGEAVFRRCMACHAVGPGARDRPSGPHLNGIIGQEAGANPGFNYSNANKESGIVWDAETLMAYLENPRQFLPGTRMAFPGLSSEQDRADVVAFLAQFDAEGDLVSED